MGEYIKREDARQAILNMTMCKGKVPMCSVLWSIDHVPSVDLPTVVRCKDCMHNGSFDTDCPFGWRDERFKLPDDIDFCSYGELKEQDNE